MVTSDMGQETSRDNVGYRNLNVFQKSNNLVLLIYKLTKLFPREELFGLTSQIRRCAVSVPANIVEGYGRRTKKDQVQFYYQSRASLNELEYFIDLAYNINYLDKVKYLELKELRDEVGRMLNGFIKSFD